MTARQVTVRSLALAATIAVVAAPLAAQQDTTRMRRTTSQTRISVSKGEVELPPRVDTVYTTRYDTVRVDRTIVRVDTVTIAAPVPMDIRDLNDWYWSVFAGATAPAGSIDDLYTNGYHGGGAVGWDPRDSWIGGRLSAQLSQIGREQGFSTLLVGSGTPLMWQVSGDLKAKANFGGWSLYGVGGLGFNSYARMATVADFDAEDLLLVNPLADGTTRACAAALDTGDNEVNVTCFRPATGDWTTDFSWNFGVGTDFHIGSQDMFLEVRWNPITTHGAHTWFVPISFGVRYF